MRLRRVDHKISRSAPACVRELLCDLRRSFQRSGVDSEIELLIGGVDRVINLPCSIVEDEAFPVRKALRFESSFELVLPRRRLIRVREASGKREANEIEAARKSAARLTVRNFPLRGCLDARHREGCFGS